MNRILIELADGTELEIRRRSPIIVDTTCEPAEESGAYPALARCAPEPHITISSPMRGRLRPVRAA